MNILMVNKFYYLRGGAERSFFETSRILEEHGHRVIPFAMRDERNRQTPYGKFFVDHVEFNQDHSIAEKLAIVSRVVYFRQARRRLERLLRAEQIDIAHLHNIAHQISPSILDSLRRHGIPVVQTLHDYKLICPTYNLLASGRICERCHGGRYYHTIGQRCNKGSLSASMLNAVEMYTHRALRIYQRGIDRFISPSHFLRRKLQADGVSTPIFYLPNAVELAQYQPADGQGDYCVYFGRLSPEKGVRTLITAVAGCPQLRLKIVGDGLQREELEAYCRARRLANVEFLGSQYGEELKSIVREALFVVIPSEWYENCPYVILESFALGKPVVGSNLGGIPELITHGRDGFLFASGDSEDLKDKLERLADDEETRIRMGRNARQKVEQRFNLASHYEQLMEAYDLVFRR